MKIMVECYYVLRLYNGKLIMLSDVIGAKSTYFIPKEPIDRAVLIPALTHAESVDFAVGYFNSGALRSIAPGLAQFINGTTSSMRLITSPQLDESDYIAIQRGNTDPIEVISRRMGIMMEEVKISADLLAKHTLDCLSYLIATRRLILKLAYVSGAVFHPKIWIISSGSEMVAVSGSQNLTGAGMNRNIEQMRVDRSWGDASSKEAVLSYKTQFDLWWNDADESARTFDASSKVMAKFRTIAPPSAPTEKQYISALGDIGIYSPPPIPKMDAPKRLEIPKQYDLFAGDFSHQGEALKIWTNRGSGILEMATGSGKTITALASAAIHNTDTPKIVFVAVPITPLGKQWENVAAEFGVIAVNTVDIQGSEKRASEIRKALRRVESNASHHEVVLITHDFLCSETFTRAINQATAECMLIADEVHHLGRPAFRSVERNMFTSVMGLSATPTREWDDDGNDLIESFFGPVIFQFTLAQAIGKCLVPYEYHIHEVPLTLDEEVEYDRLSDRARALGWMADKTDDDGPSTLQRILLDRRRVLEIAAGKIGLLSSLIAARNRQSISHMLIYASDKYHGQINEINALMRGNRIRFHQFTGEETSNRNQSVEILENFRTGGLQVLTAMRVLDEGVDIPQVKEALILASNTGARQWVQRRGRVLRMSPETKKEKAIIHDFVVTSNTGSSTDHNIDFADKSEFSRVIEFASLAINATATGGPLVTASKLIGG